MIIPMEHLRQTPKNSAMFWLNMEPSDDKIFQGNFGSDEPPTGGSSDASRMLLKYSILEDTV